MFQIDWTRVTQLIKFSFSELREALVSPCMSGDLDEETVVFLVAKLTPQGVQLNMALIFDFLPRKFNTVYIVQDEDAKLLAEYKKQLAKKTESKIIKKAVGIKKKQIVREEEIDEISEDETPIEVVKEIIKKRRQPAPKKQLPPRQQPEPEPQKMVLSFF